MKALFWISLALVGYTYFGYAILLALLARLRPRPFLMAPGTPSVSIVIAAHNEEAGLPRKLENLAQLHYPAHLLEIVVASDGSTDGTIAVLNQYATQPESRRIKPVVLHSSRGKAFALTRAVREAEGEILVFLDVRQTIEPDAVSELVACFADPEVGAVSGELLLHAGSSSTNESLGLYWKIEKVIRKLESQTGSVVGATGAIYAIRSRLFVPIPEGTILDDVFVPMNVARTGKRVVFQPSAIAHDQIFAQKGKEFGRKTRTLTGNYQLLRLAPWLISFRNPLLFRFLSHKLARLSVPVFLITLLVSSSLQPGGFFLTTTVLQLIFYALALLGSLNPGTQRLKPVAIANTFVMLNVAAVVAFWNFVTGREKVWA